MTVIDALVAMEKAMKRDKIDVNDRQLACARIHSEEGQDYLKGMAAAANYAWVNRSSMTFLCRQVKWHVTGFLLLAATVIKHCWLGIRKGMWPVKNWVMKCRRGYLSGAKCKWSAYGPTDATAPHHLLLL